MEPPTNWLPLDEVQRIAALLGEVAGIEEDVRTRKQLLLRRMRNDVQADSWLWTLTQYDRSKNSTDVVIVQSDGLTDLEQSRWTCTNTIPHRSSTCDSRLPAGAESAHDRFAPGATQSSHATQLDDVELPNAGDCRNCDRMIQVAFRLCRDTSSEIRFFRHFGRNRFTDRDRRYVQIIWSHVPWLHQGQVLAPTARVATRPVLTHARRIVLAHLLAGRRRPEIARLLNISQNTARDHVRAVLRHFDAKDQVELVCRYASGDIASRPRVDS